MYCRRPSFGGAGFWFLFYPPRANVSESGPIPSIRWELWRNGLEEAEYFFHLQRLLASGQVPRGQVAEAKAALDAVGGVAWDFVYYSDHLKKTMRPYSANASLARLNNTASWSLRRPLLTAEVQACWLYRGASRSQERPGAHDRRKGGSNAVLFLLRRPTTCAVAWVVSSTACTACAVEPWDPAKRPSALVRPYAILCGARPGPSDDTVCASACNDKQSWRNQNKYDDVVVLKTFQELLLPRFYYTEGPPP